LITKNEERHLKKCLSSVSSLSDEIILVDTGSNDRTLEIAEEFKCKKFSIPWKNDFSYARNYAIDQASGDWILFLDADEHLICNIDIRIVLGKITNNVGGLIIPRYDHFKNEKTNKITTIPIGIVRLFRNNKGFKYCYPVHEIINESIIENEYLLTPCNDIVIFHRIHEHSNEFVRDKQIRYLDIINQNLYNDKGDINYWLKYQQAKTFWYLEKLNEAEDSFSFIIHNSKSLE